MADVIKLVVPDIGDFTDVEVIEILVKAGDTVAVEESLITLETDKATMDIPSQHAGEITKMLVSVGDKVNQGDAIAELSASAQPAESQEQPADSASEPAPTTAAAPEEEPTASVEQIAQPVEEKPAPTPTPDVTTPTAAPPPIAPVIEDLKNIPIPHASPSVRALAREFGVNLNLVEGTGRKRRILKEDVQHYVKAMLQKDTATGGGNVFGIDTRHSPFVDPRKFGDVVTYPLPRIQKLSSKHLHACWLAIPHVTQFEKADVTDLEDFRKSYNKTAKSPDHKLTVLAFMMKAAAIALKEYPHFNACLDEEKTALLVRQYINIGFAVDTPDGLVVPVMRDVMSHGIAQIADALRDISRRARAGELEAKDMQGAGFTISSLGGIGGTAFTPIINAPEVAILGLSKAQTEPVWNAEREAFIPRLLLPLSLSYDHRVIDGAAAARFIVFLGQLLSDIRRLSL